MSKKPNLFETFLVSILLCLSLTTFSQEKPVNYLNITNLCSLDSIKKNLTEFEQLGIKEVNTASLKNTANWLINKYKSYGYNDLELDPFSYAGDNLNNLIVTKIGSIYPDSVLIICGHYDTKNGSGIGDNGSGTAVILEIARILKNTETKISIRFIHFAGEEDGLFGSEHYVNQTVIKQKSIIKLVFNIDAVGGVSSKTNDKIVCESDQNNNPETNNEQSLIYTQLLASYMQKYSALKTSLGKTYASDYMPFQSKGYIITGLYEFNQSPYAHSSKDVLLNVDIQYIYEVAKGAIGASLNFSNSD